MTVIQLFIYYFILCDTVFYIVPNNVPVTFENGSDQIKVHFGRLKGNATLYQVVYCTPDNATCSEQVVPAGTPMMNINSLQPFTNYTVWITVVAIVAFTNKSAVQSYNILTMEAGQLT